ncbi:MAG: winged helix DNA-binding domain-containing protein [Actinomycetota bacterium]|nr:winged helix DNA-binding domain-containing protein [Actinomycetota bacterium]
MDVIRDLGCLQLDPISVLARSHLLVLWSRLGPYALSDLDTVLWKERRLFEYWAHMASIVLTEDYPIHHLLMRQYPYRGWRSGLRQRTAQWLEDNRALRRYVLTRLRREGPLRLRDFEDRAVTGWQSSGWNLDRNVDRMLDILWTQGRIMVVGRDGIQKIWDLAERWLPDWTPRARLSEREVVRRAAQRSLRALGVARRRDIERHFTVFRYPGLRDILPELEKRGVIQQVRISGRAGDWPGPWYVHASDLPLLDALEADHWEPRTTLLSPFDNLIIDRDRTELLFGFRFRMEIYVPKEKRQYGYYVLPILHGDELIGRVDPMMDRQQRRLIVNSLHAEPQAPGNAETGEAIAHALRELARFLGGDDIEYRGDVPAAWRKSLR